MNRVEILRGTHTAGDLRKLINNEGIREPFRRYAPSHFAVYVGENGSVELVARSKEPLDIEELYAIRARECPGTVFFLATTGQYSADAELKKRLDDCFAAHKETPPSSRMEERVVEGKRTLLIRAGVKNGGGDGS